MKSIKVKIWDSLFNCKIASTREEQYTGLGNTDLKDDQGMLFVYNNDKVRRFCMRNCPQDLDIVYMDKSGSVITAYTMKAEDPKQAQESDLQYESRLREYTSGSPCRFALELPAGTIKRFDIKSGEVIRGVV